MRSSGSLDAMVTHLASRQNPRVKELVKLRLRRQRQTRDRIIIDGAREILRAQASGVVLVEVYACLDALKNTEAQNAWAQASAGDVAQFSVTSEVYEKIRFGERSDGIVAVAQTPRRVLEDLLLPASPLVAVIEGIEKPGNVGAIVRSADGAGVDGVIVVGTTDLYHPHTVRNSLGCVFSSHVLAASLQETFEWLRRNDLSLFAARPSADRLYWQVDFCGATALLLGSEAQGLSPLWDDVGAQGIGLPMHGLADSLNVSAAAAVLFYEAVRQRSF